MPVTPAGGVFADLLIDHIGFTVTDLDAAAGWFTGSFGLPVYAATAGPAGAARSAALGGDRIRLVLTEPLAGDHPGARYLDRHGDGVADIALRVGDAAAAYAEAVRRGARPVAAPARHGTVVTATVLGFGDVAHTFVQRTGGSELALPGLRAVEPAPAGGTGLGIVDHLAVCLEPGELDRTVAFYRQVLDFELIFTEHIAVGDQAMTTKVVQGGGAGGVTLTLIEPDVTRAPGHIDDFLRDHRGAGVQHIAFSTDDIVSAVDTIGGRGVRFLDTPATYYQLLPQRLELGRYSVAELQRRSILVDEDHDGQLYQIFARSIHPRNTLFFELIERLGARSFGSGNIAALYQAVELQRGRGTATGDRPAAA